MQWLLIVMLTSSTGVVEYHEPTVLYSKKSCKDAQEVIRAMTPGNAATIITTACIPRGSNRSE